MTATIGSTELALPTRQGVALQSETTEVLAELADDERIRSARSRKYQREGNVTIRTAIPFGLKFVESLDTSFPAREVAGAVLCERRQIAVFDGRPLCELMSTEMAESKPTEKDGEDSINVDSDPFYD